MAKITVDGPFPRRIDDYVLYKLDDQIIMRATSGFTSEALKTATKYALSRQNASEFGRLSSICKALRLALKDYLPKQNNLLVVNSLVKKMRQLLVYDCVSVRGERTLANAMATVEARAQFKGYSFNPVAVGAFKTVFNAESVAIATANIIIPEGATSVAFTLVSLVFDFDTKASFLTESQHHFYGLTALPDVVELVVPKIERVSGELFTIMVVAFYFQDETGFVPLKDDSSKVVLVLD